MGRVYADVTFIGGRARKKVNSVLFDTGADYTISDEGLLLEVGAIPVPGKVKLKLGEGRSVRAKPYALHLKAMGREAPVIVLTFRGAQRVVGLDSLERLRLRVNKVSGKLESVSPRSIVFYRATLQC